MLNINNSTSKKSMIENITPSDRTEGKDTQFEIKEGDLLLMKDGKFRVITLNDDFTLIIETDVKHYNIVVTDTRLFILSCSMEEVKVLPEVPVPIIEIPEETLQLQKKIDELLERLYPDLDELQKKTTVKEIAEIAQEFGITKKYVHARIRSYLQSGREPYALMDGRTFRKVSTSLINKDGTYRKSSGPMAKKANQKFQITQETLNTFDRYFIKYLKVKEKGTSVNAIYNKMLREVFSTTDIVDGKIVKKYLPVGEHPSYKVFLSYVKKRLGTVSIRQSKLGKRNIFNSERVLKGNAQTGVSHPGQLVEIDEMEADIELVSEVDHNQVIGRVIIHFAVDIYSRIIIGCWVGLNNNSNEGLMNLFMTLLEDHQKLMKPYNISAPEGLFPSHIIPESVRVDHGSEYTSKHFRRFCKELGITIRLVSKATGSMKGVVEQSFHQYQQILRDSGTDAGIILKSHDSNHFRTAVLDLNDVWKTTFTFVLYYNQQTMSNYPMTKDMIKKGVHPTPAQIWDYGIKNISSPKKVTSANHDRILFAMLDDSIHFSVSRKGISAKGLYYFSENEYLYSLIHEAGKKSKRLPGVRTDPRDVSAIYLLHDNELIRIPLNLARENQRSFLSLTWEEYLDLMENKQALIDESKDTSLISSLHTRDIIDETFATAKKMRSGKKNKTDMRAARAEEKARNSHEASVYKRFFNDDKPDVPVIPEHVTSSDNIEIIEVSDDPTKLSGFDKFFK